MDQAPTPAFNAASFKAQLRERIQAMAPKTAKEADEFKEKDKLGEMKGDMQGKVSQEKSASQNALQDKTKAPPDPSGIEPKPVTELPAPNPGAAPGSVGAQDAAPKPKTPSEVEKPFQENSKSLDKQMADENVTEQQLSKSNEPEFQGALASKQEAQTQAAKAPQEYRGYEGEEVNKAKAQAAGTAQSHLHSMHGARAQALTQIAGHQTGAKAQEEAARAKVSGDIQKIYDKTKTNVETLLAKLDTDANAAFDTGSQAANRTFEDFVAAKMDAFKEDRYGGWFGWARWAKDKIAGMPDEVNQFYTDGRLVFLNEMDKVIDKVADIIARGLNEAKAEVAKGKKEIETYVAQLPNDLKDVGTKASNDIQDKFDSLESKIDAKQNELVEQLATKYNEKLKAVDARIEELKAANQGLIDKAKNFVAGVIRVIKKLKDMIVNILSRIADVVMGIISDPIGFLGNLIDGIKSGLDNFISNLPKHLLNALLTWLTGELGPMGIKLPDDIFSLEGIFSLVMQILGLTWDAIRAKAVKLLGENVVKGLEKTFEIFQVLKTEGVTGLWKYVKEMFGNIKEMVIDTIMDLIQTEVIQAGIKWILGLLTPAGAFIKAAMAIYDIVKFFIDNASKIADLIEAIIDGIAEIAKGSISGAAKLIENALAKALPIVIGFLASLLGIGDLSKKVKGLIEKIREKIDKAIEWVINKAKAAAGKVMGVLGFGDTEKEGEKEKAVTAPGEAAATEAVADAPVQQTFSMNGNPHELFVEPGPILKIEMASSKRDLLSNKIGRAVGTLMQQDPQPSTQIERLKAIGSMAKQLQNKAKEKGINPGTKLHELPGFENDLKSLAVAIQQYADDFNQSDIGELLKPSEKTQEQQTEDPIGSWESIASQTTEDYLAGFQNWRAPRAGKALGHIMAVPVQLSDFAVQRNRNTVQSLVDASPATASDKQLALAYANARISLAASSQEEMTIHRRLREAASRIQELYGGQLELDVEHLTEVAQNPGIFPRSKIARTYASVSGRLRAGTPKPGSPEIEIINMNASASRRREIARYYAEQLVEDALGDVGETSTIEGPREIDLEIIERSIHHAITARRAMQRAGEQAEDS
jgi:hypothetical protein